MKRSWKIPLILVSAAASARPPQDRAEQPRAAQQVFATNCAGCHGEDALGSAKGPSLAMNPRVSRQTAEQLLAYLQHGNTAAGMPSFSDLPADELTTVARYLRRLNPQPTTGPVVPLEPSRKITWGDPQPGDWLTYNGNYTANRYSQLKQINTLNVASLKLKWVFPMSYAGIETTPLEADGVMFVTGQNEVFALDALTGNAIWHYARPASPGMVGDAKLGTNKGVAILGEKVFFVTDNAHLLALHRADGRLLWEVPLAPDMSPAEKFHYGGTMAPLIVHDTVVVGVAGADEGIRGFVAAYRPTDGTVVWRRWTIPLKGEPGSETWEGPQPLTGGGSTWLTGSFDASSDTLYWATGNPWPDSNDSDRPGDNLYTDCVLALNAKTGEIKWHYQFTPHDVRDRDATEPNVLVDTVYKGTPSKLLLHADRNGFFYVLDRTTGEVLLAKPFLRNTQNFWAKSIASNGKPVLANPRGCPDDAANWDSTAYSPETHLYYVIAMEECFAPPVAGSPPQPSQRFLRALNIETGAIVWEIPQTGPAPNKLWTGVVATAGGLLFYGQPSGGFAAVNQKTGKTLWRFDTNTRMKASPITFSFGGKQYVAVAAGPNILCFGM
jgi:PQQ-dependent dehydrogenase (methanol/ethanol family)